MKFQVVFIVILVFVIAYLFKDDLKVNTFSNTPSTFIESTPTPTLKPISERALRLAAQVMIYSNEKEKKEFMENYGGENESEAAKNLARFLDKNPEKLIFVEQFMKKYLSEKSKQNIYIESPKLNLPKSCTSNTIGDYTYTNCY